MKKNSHIFSVVAVLLLIAGCSTKKDAFLNRSLHSVSTKFNVLFNGNEALKSGLIDLNDNYDDDYWKRLPIEPLKIEELALPGVNTNGDSSPEAFQKAEEKAVKAIQKHSMNIGGEERNKQIDNAYLLLGKARYYSQRFVPALEAFNYIIQYYPQADLINETKIWQSKSHIRLRNEEQAIETLQIMLSKENLPDNIRADAHTAIAMAFTKMKNTQEVLNHLNNAVLYDKNSDQKARNLFILGQIYREEQKIDSSNVTFDAIIDFRKAPYKYKIHAHIEKAKNSSEDSDNREIIEKFEKLIADRDNRSYLDELYYHTGTLELKNGNDTIAESYYIKSIQARGAKEFQKGLSYEALANLNFDRTNFPLAGAYYDSILALPQDTNTKRIRRIKRIRKNLDEVILYENMARTNDSILSVAHMTDEEREDYFTKHIAVLKELEESQKEKAESITFGNAKNSNNTARIVQGNWYFYNIQVVGYGAQEFERKWGNRPLEDNWRLSNKSIIEISEANTVGENRLIAVNNEIKYDLDFYLSQIPKGAKQLDSISSIRNEAYYRLGLIYKEQFKEYNIASGKLEQLLEFNPDSHLVLPAKYHLYKIYEILEDAKKDIFRNDIVVNYPDSKYAKIILNPNEVITNANDENSPEKIYAETYYNYKDEKYDEVIIRCNSAINDFEGLVIIPKFELLKAYAIGKKEGINAFKEALEFVVMNYPTSEEGKKALEVIDTIKKKL